MRKEWLAVVSIILVTMKTDDGLRRGAIMFITKKFGIVCCTVYHLWERAKTACDLGIINSPAFTSCDLGIINSPAFTSCQKTLEEGLRIQLSLFGKVSSTCL